jgi:hypothetical protein
MGTYVCQNVPLIKYKKIKKYGIIKDQLLQFNIYRKRQICFVYAYFRKKC